MSSEYSFLIDFFKEKGFQSQLLHLKKQLRNKKVVLYCNGIFFDALADTWNLSDYFNIAGISDLRYETETIDYYKNFKCIKPSQLKNTEIDCILITSPNPLTIKKFLHQENICSNKTKIISILETSQNPVLILKDKAKLFLEYVKETSDIFKGVKYTLFCPNDEFETKINYERVIKKLKSKFQSNPNSECREKIRALFICEENQKWGYSFVYEQLKNNENFEVLPIVLYPIVTKNRKEFTQKENEEFFKKQGIETIDGYDYETNKNKDIKSFEPDLVFYQQPWYLQGKNHPKMVSQYALTMMIPYGYTTLSPNSWGSDAVKKVYSSLWTFFSESPYHNKFYEKAANMKHKDNLFASGSPKMDFYGTKADEKFEKLWKNPNSNEITARLIWAPHHSVGGKGLGMSNFEEQSQFFLDFAKNNPQYSFVLKPHPALKNACQAEGFLTNEQYDSYIQEWNSLGNASVYTLGNYFDIFKTSDVLITDCSSFLAEYFPSKKPIIFLDKATRAPFDSFGEAIKKGFYRIQNTNELDSLLKQLFIEKDDRLLGLRKKLLKKHFFIPEQSSSKQIVDFICAKII